METLNQDCLEQIFKFLTPVEWIQVSQVCRFWNTTAQPLWKKITKINYNKIYYRSPNPPVITDAIAAKIVLYAAPYVKIVKLHRNGISITPAKFGAYEYLIEKSNSKRMVQLLALLLIKKSTEITEFHWFGRQNEEILAHLFRKNKIKKVVADNAYAFHRKIPTESIEDLDVIIESKRGVESFEGCFPNLKKLEVYVLDTVPKDKLYAILPYVSGITSLNLTVCEENPNCTIPQNLLWNIIKMTELEELWLAFREVEVTCLDPFINELAISCPKLRSVKVAKTNIKYPGLNITRNAFHALLSFPNLEKLIVTPVEGFGSIDLPEMKRLTDFGIGFVKQSSINVTSLCCFIKQMPMLQNLMIANFMGKEQVLQLVGKIVVYAASKEKSVVVLRRKKYFKNDVFDRLKISRKNVWGVSDPTHEQDQTLNILIRDEASETHLDDVKVFVETKMKDYETSMTNAIINVPLFKEYWG